MQFSELPLEVVGEVLKVGSPRSQARFLATSKEYRANLLPEFQANLQLQAAAYALRKQLTLSILPKMAPPSAHSRQERKLERDLTWTYIDSRFYDLFSLTRGWPGTRITSSFKSPIITMPLYQNWLDLYCEFNRLYVETEAGTLVKVDPVIARILQIRNAKLTGPSKTLGYGKRPLTHPDFQVTAPDVELVELNKLRAESWVSDFSRGFYSADNFIMLKPAEISLREAQREYDRLLYHHFAYETLAAYSSSLSSDTEREVFRIAFSS